ncbi:hypothetical protein BKA70DRAFT_1464386 [Coprinopsis sp. MPI-PUGE-AT-0042]|nr:hypothetical protein BKA70DRAFT_1464386 [Coprinopsis sp. MPI-PUGE-AT-0042]
MSPAVDIFNWNLGFFFTTAVVSLCVAAIQLFMWCYMISRFKATPSCRGTRGTHVLYLCASFCILALSVTGAIIWGISIYDILLRIVPGEDNISAGWDIIDYVYQRVWVKGEIALNIVLWVGDALLVYRCYVIWSEYIWVYCLPFIMWISTIAIGIPSFIPGQKKRTLDIANVFIVVAFHILVTFLIAIRLIHAHRRLRKSFPLAKHNEYLSALAIIVESAAPLAVFGLGTAISGLFDTSVVAVKTLWIFQICLWASAMLAPQLIIFRVATGRSWATKDESVAIFTSDFEAAVGSLNSEEFKECEAATKRCPSVEGSGTESRHSKEIF